MASYVLPHTPTHSPTRPVSSYSTRSTIRRVTPSPESLSEALSQGFAKQSTPRHSVHSLGHLPAYKHISGRGKIQIPHQNETRYPEQVPGCDKRGRPPQVRTTNGRKITPCRIPQPTHVTPTTTTTASNTGSRRITPTRRVAAPRKHRRLSAQTAAHALAGELPDSQANLGPHIQLLPAQTASTALAVQKQGTQQADEGTGMEERERAINPTVPARRRTNEDPTQEHNYHSGPNGSPQIQPQLLDDPDKPTPVHAFPALTSTPSRPHAAQRSKSTTSTISPQTPQGRSRNLTLTSVPSTTFSTPGRDEMERKKGATGIVDIGDEGPFGRATGMRELEERRRQISVGKRSSKGSNGEEKKEKEREQTAKKKYQQRVMCRCIVM